ncbi:hypothetical protein ACQKIC_05450 [Peribacillus sp. NPDC046944]|uniref:hypothetical protein n=1 Tax=unclassified Peribacillus TaxID=2675266 RepID=UPI003D08A3EA
MPYAFELKIDFKRDWTSFLKRMLINAGYKHEDLTTDVCFQYFNYARRLISPLPRKVLISKEFHCPEDLKEGLDLIIGKIKKGMDLKPHLSKGILNLNYHDDLLNDWGIHHLHLGVKIDKTGFSNRTGPVLFVRFDNKHAYIINVMKHGSWTNQEMIRIIHNNWPKSIERFQLNGVTAASPALTDEQYKKARQSHSIVLVEAEKGAVYGPLGMGYATSGHSIEVTRTCDFFAIRLREYEKYIKENTGSLVKQMRATGVEVGKKLNFLLGIENDVVYALEVNNRVFIKLGPLL